MRLAIVLVALSLLSGNCDDREPTKCERYVYQQRGCAEEKDQCQGPGSKIHFDLAVEACECESEGGRWMGGANTCRD